MRINNIQNQNFNGKYTQQLANKASKVAGNLIDKNYLALTALAGSSVIAQKVVMSGSEAVIGPMMDIGIGKAITKATKETDNSTNKSSEVQAIRTFSQSVGGTIVGVILRAICIGAATMLCGKAAQKGTTEIAKLLNENLKVQNKFTMAQNADKWGKAIGGAVSVLVMMFTNFVIDVPIINKINQKTTEFLQKHKKPQTTENNNKPVETKEVK